jgi:ATPase family associated with various cellular activities (AAA)/Winged helix domain, variant
MSDLSEWQQRNAVQLAAALRELRQRLENFSQISASGDGAKPKSYPTALPQETKPATETPSALELLTERLGLSPFERNVLFLCTAMELDTRIAGLCARAQGDQLKPYPTFALVLALFDEASWDILSPERPLRYWRLIDVNQPGATPLTSAALRADERIVNYIKGLNHVDDRVSSFLAPLETDAMAGGLSASQAEIVEQFVARWHQLAQNGPAPGVQFMGTDPISKQLVALHAAGKLGCRLCRMPIDFLPAQPADLELLARLWERESRLLPLALYLDAQDLDSGSAERLAALDRFLARSNGVFFIGVREVLPRLGCTNFVLDVSKPTAAEQLGAWKMALGAGADGTAPRLTSQFNLNLPTIARLASEARADVAETSELLPEKIWDACRAHERPRLDALAQRLEPKATWDDIVLPKAELDLLRQIAAQVGQRTKVYAEWGFDRKMNRGFGISALFAGDSGVGKTMAAEVLANELRLNLYRIDLSAVVSKYIGETEKNLRRLFDAAEDGGAILFFDEADALFGKRSEVKDSHDRYANIEINYLLQRIESYRGLAILATNMKSALDTAFMRRLRFLVNFPFPGVADRRVLWRKVFPQRNGQDAPHTPLAELDYDKLARLNLNGGNIHNIALNAAFLAAHAGTCVTMPLILEAVRTEFRKLDRPVNESDFRWTERVPTALKPEAKNIELELI